MAGNENIHYYNDAMSAASVPTPFKILCVFGVAVMMWMLASGDEAVPIVDINDIDNTQVTSAGSLENQSPDDLQRHGRAVGINDRLSDVIPPEHRAPIANGVYQSYSGQPIAGAQVELWLNKQIGMGIANVMPLSFAAEYITTTNADGEFNIPFSQLSPRQPQLGLMANGSEYLLLLRHPDYADHREMRLMEFGEVMQVIATQPKGLFSGSVSMSISKPASKTAVIVDGQLKTWTSAFGEFKLNLAAGEHQLVLMHDSGALRVALIITGNHVQQFVIPRAESIAGAVQDFNGQPLSGIEIEAVRESTHETSGLATARAISDNQGRFHLRGLADGQYHLRALYPQREYWRQSVEAGATDVQLQINDKVFGFSLDNVPAYAVWNNLTVVAEHQGNQRALHSQLTVGQLLSNYQYFLEDSVDATRLVITLQAAGYKPLRIAFDVDDKRPRQMQTHSLVAEEQSAALRLAFKAPADVQAFGLRYALRRVGSDSIVTQASQEVYQPHEGRYEYYYPHLLAGQYQVELQIERNAFFDLPEINIAGSSVIKIEPDENNFIELDLVVN
jgi:protocatechuate 3,4-dioxygenase beta subunit